MALLLLLHRRATTNAFTRTLFHGLLSTGDDQPPSNSNSPFSSYFGDIKQQNPSSPLTNTNASSLQLIPTQPLHQISFEDLYKRNIAQNPDDSSSSPTTGIGNSDSKTAKPNRRTVNIDAIRESLRQMKYFHRDNMSSAEKLKIELTKVGDEFKMSESDCGSTRVQAEVANLTEEDMIAFRRKQKRALLKEKQREKEIHVAVENAEAADSSATETNLVRRKRQKVASPPAITQAIPLITILASDVPISSSPSPQPPPPSRVPPSWTQVLQSFEGPVSNPSNSMGLLHRFF